MWHLAAAFAAGAAAAGGGVGFVLWRRLRKERRQRSLELRLALEKLANGGWTLSVDEDLDPEVARSVRVVNAVLDNMERALRRLMDQNEELRGAARLAMAQFAREKERLEAVEKSARITA